MSNAQGSSAFAAGAARLEQIARSLKPQQANDGQGSFQVASSRMMAISPDEMWARQFSSQCIGPVCFKVAPGSDMALPPLTQAMQSVAPVRQAAAPQAPMPVTRTAAAPSRPVPMGTVIGKPVRRGLFRRLFGAA
jgi:hypothetical protein